MRKISVESLNRMTALVIGKAGIGKTSLLRTIPEGEKVCVLSAESGLLCVRDLVLSGKVEGFEISNFEELKQALSFFQSGRGDEYQWIFIDSLTEIAARCVESVKEKYINSKDTFKMWGEYNDMLTKIIKDFRDLTSHSVVFTCLPSIEKDEENRRYIGPSMSGSQLKERLTSYFDEVFYMMPHESGPRIFITQPDDTRIPAKDRSGKLNSIEKPDLGWIKNKIMRGEGE